MRIILAVLLFFGSGFGQTPTTVKSSNGERARRLLDDSLNDKNPDTRKHAVQALGLISSRDSYRAKLEEMIEDKDVEVRLAVIASLVDLKDKRTLPTLRKALDSDVPEVSFAAAKALWMLKDPLGRKALVSVLSGDRKASSGFLTKQKREALRMLHTPRTMFLFALRQGTGFVPVPAFGAGISSLQGILTDPGVSGRAAAALLLSMDRSSEVLQALRDALVDEDWTVRAAAVHAISLRDDPALKPDLVPLLDDAQEAVRDRAAAGYLRLESIRPQPSGKKPAGPQSSSVR